MTFASASQFHIYLLLGQRPFSIVFLLVRAFQEEKALVGAFSVIVKTDCKTDGLSAALVTSYNTRHHLIMLAQYVSWDHVLLSPVLLTLLTGIFIVHF